MRALILTISAFLVIAAGAHAAPMESKIRVAVLSDPYSITVEAQAGGILAIEGARRGERWEGPSVTISRTGSSLRVNGRPYEGGEIIISSKSGTYRIGERFFKGILHAVIHNNKIVLVNHVPLEIYITGLINSEISSSWPEEAIKAQAVAARTYALNQIERTAKSRLETPYDIESTMMDQVYAGAHREDTRSRKTVEVTRGQVLLRNGLIFPAFYHSCCGGITEAAHNVWSDAEGPPPVEDRYCERSPKRDWTYTLSQTEFLKMLPKNGTGMCSISHIMTVPLFDSPRIDTVIIESGAGSQNIKATELRKILGYANLKSTWFEVSLDGRNVTFKGRGYGHGVGMCQWGAKGMAEEGLGYREILKFYYPDAEIATMY